MKRFNIQNDSYKTGDYPLFFGKPLGLFDVGAEPYPELVKLSDDQQSLFWKSNDIALTQDAVDMKELDENMLNLTVENLSFQMAGDSYVNGIISDLFSSISSNNALTELVSYWSFTETVHAKAYGRIIAEAFPDQTELFDKIRSSEKMLTRLSFLIDTFNEHGTMLKIFDSIGHKDYLTDPDYYQETVLKTLTALLAFEGICFMGSFACTFAVNEVTQKLNGIDKLVALISDDESISHRNNGIAILKILRDKEKYSVWDETIPEMKKILDGVVMQELDWVSHLFTVCDPILGLNTELLQDYIYYLSKLIYDELGIQFDFKVVEKSPFDGWMQKHTQADLTQTANQEVEAANYLTSASIDDTDNIEAFDF